MIRPEAGPAGYTVGICATGPSKNVVRLVNSVLGESRATPLPLERVIVVASECPGPVNSGLMAIASADNRVLVLLEDVRRGKAEAVNRILSGALGRFVVMVNADALPEPGAISRLLSTISSEDGIGAVSAMPIVDEGEGVTSMLVDMIWRTHTESSRLLNHMNISNHASEELVVFRASAIGMLPADLVNDGAYLASAVRRRGRSVRFSEAAKVRIETPIRVSDLIAQRRRILFGHAQVWRKAGAPPKTIESLLLLSPSIGFRLFVQIVSRSPRYLFILPLAFVTEVSAALLSIWDSLGSTKKHIVWRRFT